MNIELRARLAAIASKAFEGNEGEHVEYQEAYFQYQNDEGQYEVAKVNTKKDLIPDLGKKGVVKIAVQENGKLKLISFIPSNVSE